MLIILLCDPLGKAVYDGEAKTHNLIGTEGGNALKFGEVF